MPTTPTITVSPHNYSRERDPAAQPNPAENTTPAPVEAQQPTPEQPRNIFENINSRKEIDDKIKELEKEIKKAEKMPSHNELFGESGVYEHGKKETRTSTEEAVLRKAFKQTNINKRTETEQDTQMREQLHLGFAKVLAEGENLDFNAIRAEKGPQIFIRQVIEYEDKRNWFEKTRDSYLSWQARRKGQEYKPDPSKVVAKPTNEVCVTVVMNNGTTENDNDVLTGVFKYENNKINLNEASEMTIVTEKEYKTYQRKRRVEEQFQHEDDGGVKGVLKTRTRRVSTYSNNSIAAQMARGEMTLQEYKTKFEKENGVTEEVHWERRDQMLDRDLSAAKSERYRGELMDRLSTKYNEQLQQAQERRSEIMSETARRSAETRARNNEIMNNSDFGWLVEKIQSSGDPKDIEKIRKHLLSYINRTLRDENVDAEQLLADLLKRKGVTL